MKDEKKDAAERLDILFAKKTGYSREFSKELIQNGTVTVNGRINKKPGDKIPPDSLIEYQEPSSRYVSRGGYKLEEALREFQINLSGLTCLDAGASAGGFTDCMLQAGAAVVYAVDSGSEQLDSRLRNDPRVISKERTNIRYLPMEVLKGPVDFITADLSFISLTKVIPKLWELLKPSGEAVLLIKPQFEAGRTYLNKKGVVKDIKVHKTVIANIKDFAQGIGFSSAGCIQSPIKGPEGNIEYLLYLKKIII